MWRGRGVRGSRSPMCARLLLAPATPRATQPEQPLPEFSLLPHPAINDHSTFSTKLAAQLTPAFARRLPLRSDPLVFRGRRRLISGR